MIDQTVDVLRRVGARAARSARRAALHTAPLPVAGLDALAAQSVLFTLRRWLPDEGDDEASHALAEQWLRALQLAQVASDRLLASMDAAQSSLRFWRGRLRAGAHGRFLLLAQGPSGFISDALSALRLRHGKAAASDRMEERIVALQLLATALAEALAAVHAAAALLRLGGGVEGGGGDGGDGVDAAVAAAVGPAAAGGGEAARAAVTRDAVAAAVARCADGVAAALDRLQPCAAALQTRAGAEALLDGAGFPRPPLMRSMVFRDRSTAGGGDSRAGSRAGSRVGGSAGAPRRQQQQQPPMPLTPPPPAAPDAEELWLQLEELGEQLGVPPPPSSSSRQRAAGAGAAGAWDLLALKHKRCDAGSAIVAAAALAASLGPLVAVPAWARMPSSLQRHWLRYAAAAAAGAYAAAFLYRNSRLAGSSHLEDWAKGTAAAVRGAVTEHLVEPLVVVRQELLSTYRDRPSIVSTAEFEADKQSLVRMLQQFQHDHPTLAASVSAATAATVGAAAPSSSSSSSSNSGNSSVAGASSSGASGGGGGGNGGAQNAPAPAAPGGGGAVAPSAATTMTAPAAAVAAAAASPPPGADLSADDVNRGMAVVMAAYERDLQRPILNLVTGELARTLLIQVQRLKLDTEAAMLELDQVLRQNELSISLMAALPALALGWVLLRGCYALLLVRRPPDARREALPCRLAMAELERALAALAALQEQQQQQQQQLDGAASLRAAAASPATPPPAPSRAAAAAAAAAAPPAAAAAEGAALLKLAAVYREAQRVFRLKDSSSRFSEWPHLRDDILELVTPGVSAARKLDLHRRMLRTYTLLQP